MSSKDLFKNKSSVNKLSKLTKPVNATNNSGAVAYSLSDQSALAQLALTGCFHNTYYVSAEEQLKQVLELSNKVEPKFIAKLAVYAHENGFMKDMPAILCAILAAKDTQLLGKIFHKVLNNPKMIRNFMQIVRSGVTGKKSFGTVTKRLITQWIDSLTDEQVFKANIGNDPSLADIIKMIHPKPANRCRAALYGYLLNKGHIKKDLCQLVKNFEAFKENLEGEIPEVPFQMLTALPLQDHHWKEIAANATWTQLRMNLNSFQKHHVFDDKELLGTICQRLSNPEEIRKAKVFPYQLYTTFQNIDSSLPKKIGLALQKAADVALENIPEFPGQVIVMVDTSGSMSSPVTGNRGSVTTKTRCIDVAALFASAILRKNPEAEIIPFDTQVHEHSLNSNDSIVTNAQKLASFGGGGTNCAAALAHVNKNKGVADTLIFISDNESNVSPQNYRSTNMMAEWDMFKKRNPSARMTCLDITPNNTTQAHDRSDILNLGGFSDLSFEIIAKFMEMGNDKNLWIKTIESVKI